MIDVAATRGIIVLSVALAACAEPGGRPATPDAHPTGPTDASDAGRQPDAVGLHRDVALAEDASRHEDRDAGVWRPDTNLDASADAETIVDAGGMPQPCQQGLPSHIVALVCNETWPEALIVAEDFVYWSTYGGSNDIRRVPLSGGQAEILASNEGAMALAIQGRKLYWANRRAFGQVKALDLDSRTIEVLDGAQERPWDLALHGGYVYWVVGGEQTAIRRVPMAGGAVETLADEPDPLASPRHLAAGADHVYWTFRRWDGEDGIRRLRLGDTVPETIVRNIVRPTALEASAGHLYWSSENCRRNPDGGIPNPGDSNCPGLIMRAELDGSNVEIISGDPRGAAEAMTIDDRFVYWVSIWEVYRAPLTGGPSQLIDSRAGYYAGIATDQTHLYWANPVNGPERFIGRDTHGMVTKTAKTW